MATVGLTILRNLSKKLHIMRFLMYGVSTCTKQKENSTWVKKRKYLPIIKKFYIFEFSGQKFIFYGAFSFGSNLEL